MILIFLFTAVQAITYKIFLEKLTWPEALESCESRGSTLASIQTNMELFKITKQLKNKNSHFWINQNKPYTLESTNCSSFESSILKKSPCDTQLPYICQKKGPEKTQGVFFFCCLLLGMIIFATLSMFCCLNARR